MQFHGFFKKRFVLVLNIKEINIIILLVRNIVIISTEYFAARELCVKAILNYLGS